MNKYDKAVLKLFSDGIKMAMEEREIGLNELYQKAGVSKNSLYKVLRGENYEITVLIKVMRVLQIHLEFSLMSADNNVHTMGGNKINPN